MLNRADKMAIKPTSSANLVTSGPFFGITASSIKRLSKSGVAIVNAASTTNARKKRKKILR